MFFSPNGRPLFRQFRKLADKAKQNSFLLAERIEARQAAKARQPLACRRLDREVPASPAWPQRRPAAARRYARAHAGAATEFLLQFGDLLGRRLRHAAAKSEICAICAIGPRLPAPPMDFIMSAVVRCCLSRRLTSSTFAPEPAAMRFLREALRISGLRRSSGVIDRMIARCRLIMLLSIFAAAICSLILPMPGSIP